MGDLDALLTRLRAAAGADEKLDRAIAKHVSDGTLEAEIAAELMPHAYTSSVGACAQVAEIGRLRAEIGRLRVVVRVNALRQGATDAEIAAVLDPEAARDA
jgi:hypothetical protein